MDAVTIVLANRARSKDSMQSMLGASVLAHAVLIVGVVLSPVSWFGGEARQPEVVMQISLGGPEGPRDGGLSSLGARPVQEVQPIEPKRAIEPVRPPAARAPEMVEPTKDARKNPTAKVDANDPRSRTPTKGAEVQSGTAVADTRTRGTGFGLSSGGGGDGVTLSNMADFCCPEYLAQMRDLILRNWNSKQQAEGTTYLKFEIQRNGGITNIEVLRSSGTPGLDYFAQRAVTLVGQLPPLPVRYDQPVLTIRLAFEYRR